MQKGIFYCRGIFYCCSIFGYRKRLDKKGANIKIFGRKFLSHSAENFCRGIIYCCINFSYRKSWDKRGGIKNFLSKFFCLKLPKISVGESSIVALISGTKNVWRRGGGVSRFSIENFLCHSAENFRRVTI